MAKFVLAYRGGSMAQTEAEQEAVMGKWMGWFGSLGAAVVDGGAPFGEAKTVGTDGSLKGGGSGGLTGYSILEAGTIDDACSMAKSCPVLENGGTVDVYEAVPVG